MRDDTHLHAPVVEARPISRDIPWILASAAVFAFMIMAMAGYFR